MVDYRIVIDQSTSATKALLFDTTDQVKLVGRVDKPHQQIYPQKGFVEHDPIEIIENTKQVIDDLLANYNLIPRKIKSISITNQRESVVVWDGQTGQPLSNVMVWQCNRGLSICRQLIKDDYEDLVRSKTGLRLDPYFSGSKLKWFFEQVHLSDSQRVNLHVGTIDTWLVWNLTDRNRFVTEPSNACRTLLYDIKKQQWDADLCQLFDTPLKSLPKVIESDGDFGSYLGIPIVSVLADSQAALYGHGCAKPGEIKATLGTGSSLLLNIGQEFQEAEEGILTTIAWKKDEEVVYGQEGIIKSYGDTLNWVRDQLGLFDSYQAGSDLAFKLKDNEGVYFIPALEGLTAPFWKPDIHASFVGLSRNTNFVHFIRAAFESMCYQTRSVIDEYRKVGYAIDEIHMDGGSIKNPQFMQLLSDIIQTKILVGNFEELSALGALLIMKDKIDYQSEVVKEYVPQRNYDEQYYQWLSYI